MSYFNKSIEISLDADEKLGLADFYETERFVLPLKKNCKFLLRVYPNGSLLEKTFDIGCFLTNNDGPVVASRISVALNGDKFVAEKVHKVNPTPALISIPHFTIEAQKKRVIVVEVNFVNQDELAVPEAVVEIKENAIPPLPRRRGTPRRVLKAERKVKPQIEEVAIDINKDALTSTAVGVYLDSSVQEIAGYPGCTWLLRVWPNGIDIKSERNVSVAAVINDAPGFVGAITFEVIGEGDNLEVTVKEPIDGEYTTAVDMFLAHADVNKFVFDDQITIKCKIAFNPLP